MPASLILNRMTSAHAILLFAPLGIIGVAFCPVAGLVLDCTADRLPVGCTGDIAETISTPYNHTRLVVLVLLPPRACLE